MADCEDVSTRVTRGGVGGRTREEEVEEGRGVVGQMEEEVLVVLLVIVDIRIDRYKTWKVGR